MITSSWVDGLSVSNATIDDQHKQYFHLLSNLSHLLDNNASSHRITEELKAFLLFIRYHFKSEENIMLDINYADSRTHKSQHSACIETIKDFIDKFENDQILAMKILDESYTWFVMHIANHDKKLGLEISRFYQS